MQPFVHFAYESLSVTGQESRKFKSENTKSHSPKQYKNLRPDFKKENDQKKPHTLTSVHELWQDYSV